MTVAVVNLAYSSSDRLLPVVEGFGYLIPRSVSKDHNPHNALGVIFDSDAMPSLDDSKELGVTKLSVLLGGHYWSHPREVPSKEDLLKHARKLVQDHLGIDAEPIASSVKVQRSCIPQYRPGHLSRMKELHADLKERFEGRLAVVGSSYNGVGVNDCVKSAREAVERMANEGGATGLESIAAVS